jgi:hypothetical protein
MNAGQYQKAVEMVADAAGAAPAGRLYHVCFGTGDKLQIIDIWRSQAEWDAFSEIVMKVSQELGLEIASLDVEPVHNIITP